MINPFIGDLVSEDFGSTADQQYGLVTYVHELTGDVVILWEDRVKTYRTPCGSLRLVSRLENKLE